MRSLQGGGGAFRLALPQEGLLQWLFKEANTSTQAVDKQGSRSGEVFTGRCYDLDGTDDHVATDTGTNLGIFSGGSVTAFTFTARVMFDATGTQTIFGSQTSDGLFIGKDSTNKLVAAIYDGGTSDRIAVQTTGSFSVGQWYTLTVTYDGSGSASGYTVYSGELGMVVTDIDAGTVGTLTDATYDIGRWNSGMGNIKIYDARLYTSELSSAQVTAISNRTDTDIPGAFWFKCDEGDGTTAYDSSGNGNDGTITNATLSSFHTTNSDVDYSWLNQVGYSDGTGDVKIPRDESDTANDVTGSALDHAGKVKLSADFVGSVCGDFDGTDDHIAIPISITTEQYDDFTIRARFELESTGVEQVFTSRFNSNNRTCIETDGGKVNIIQRVNGTYYNISTDTVYTNGTYLDVVARFSSDGTMALWVNDVAQTHNGSSQSIVASSNGTIISGDPGAPTTRKFQGRMMNLQVHDGAYTPTTIPNNGDVLEYVFSEGAGTSIYDISGNDNHGTATNITESSFWGSTQDEFHYNITGGFEEYDDDATGNTILRVPYKVDGTQITPTISGYTKNQNNPAGAWHNDAETKIEMAVLAPSLKDSTWWYSSGTPVARSYSDIVANFGSLNITFADVSTDREKKNLVTYDAAQSGSTLEKIKSYLNIT